METPEGLQLAILSWVFDNRNCGTIPVDFSFSYVLKDLVPWFIGCGWLMFLVQFLPLVRRKLPAFPGPTTWFANIKIYIGAASDVLVCYVSLLRINFSYLSLAIVPLIAIFFICVLCMRHNQLSGHATDNGKNQKMARTTVTLGKYSIVALMAPHCILYVSGMIGDPDHDGNNYDISCFFLFLTCMLQDLTIMIMRLPAAISRGISPVSELLYKAWLVSLLLTAHMVAVNTFGGKVVMVLLPEVVPPLLWFSLHLDRRTPIFNVENIAGSEHFALKAVVVAICGCILVVPKDELLFYWAGWSCLASAVMTHILVLLLHLWPQKPGKLTAKSRYDPHNSIATISFKEVLDLLTFWGKFLVEAAAWLFALRLVAWLKSTFGQ